MIFLLSQEEGKEIVSLARHIIETYLKEGKRPKIPGDVVEEINEKRGIFVTLKKNADLRGCIGRPLPTQTLKEGLLSSSINAATKDPRFPSLKIDELNSTTVEVSVLSPPEEIGVEDNKNYPEKIKVGRDGLIVKKEGREGLLLPQVPVDHEWDEEEFLSQTCLKAGLSSDAWLDETIVIEKFSAQVFKEKEPNGDIEEKSFSCEE